MSEYPRTEAVATEIYHAWGVLLEDAKAMEKVMQTQIEELDKKLVMKEKQIDGLISDQAHWKRKYQQAMKTIDELNEAAIEDGRVG